MANITPITAYQDTTQSTTSTTWVDANCETSALVNGVEYLVIHCGNFGGDGTSAVGYLRIVHGSTVIGESSGEGRGSGESFETNELPGFKRVTGNGTDTLKFQIQAASGDTTYAGAMGIIAIPLTELTENTDFWHSGINAATPLDLENASTSWGTVRTYSPTLPETGDYLILMSVEGTPDSADSGESVRVRASADGTYICQTDSSTYGWQEESEDVADWMGMAWCTMETLSSGSRTFLIQGASETTAISDYRRSNIWVFKKSAFEQIIQNKFSSGTNTTSATYVDWTASDQAINPTEQSYIVALGYAVGYNSTYWGQVIELYNATETAEHRIDSGQYCNDYGATTDDRVPTFLAHAGQYNTGSDTWRFRIRSSDGGTVYWGRNIGDTANIQSNLILWQLTTVGAAPTPDHEAMQLGCNV